MLQEELSRLRAYAQHTSLLQRKLLLLQKRYTTALMLLGARHGFYLLLCLSFRNVVLDRANVRWWLLVSAPQSGATTNLAACLVGSCPFLTLSNGNTCSRSPAGSASMPPPS